MNQISAWSIRNPIPVILLFIVLTIAGVVGFSTMGINNNPDVEAPIIYVSAGRPGAAPSELETQVTRLIEDAVVGLGGVKTINSTVGDGYSTTIIEFELSTDVERATNDVRNAMARLRSSLPQDMQEPSVQRIDITGDSLITYVVQSPSLSPEQLSWFVDNDVSRALLAIPGIGEVNRRGGVDREIRVEIDPDRLAARGITAAQVSQSLVSANSDLPGGRVTVAGSERAIRIPGAANSARGIARHPHSAGGRQQRASGRHRQGRGFLVRAPLDRAPRRAAGRHVQHAAIARGQRGQGRRTGTGSRGRAGRGPSGGVDPADHRQCRIH